MDLAKELLLEISDQKNLLDNDPVSKQSIEMREKLILPSVTIQQFCTEEIKRCENEEQKEAYQKLLLKTLPSIINAARNSA